METCINIGVFMSAVYLQGYNLVRRLCTLHVSLAKMFSNPILRVDIYALFHCILSLIVVFFLHIVMHVFWQPGM